MDGQEKAAYIKKTKTDAVSKVLEDDADNLETHFVENPFIKIRERASAKKRFGSTALGEETLVTEKDLADGMAVNDVYYMKESGKMIVKDFEKDEKEKNLRKVLKKLPNNFHQIESYITFLPNIYDHLIIKKSLQNKIVINGKFANQ